MDRKTPLTWAKWNMGEIGLLEKLINLPCRGYRGYVGPFFSLRCHLYKN
jgi:hypothetical protein